MAKNKFSAQEIENIRHLNIQELGKLITSGEYSEKDLRKAYTQMRDIAVKRVKRLSSEKNVEQFGKPQNFAEDGDYFRKVKNLPTTSELIKEIRDVSNFLNRKTSTVKGMIETRDKTIESLKKSGFKVENKDFPKVAEFMKWFKASGKAKNYDSDSKVAAKVFNKERANPDAWEKAFSKFEKSASRRKRSRSKQY